MSEAAIKEKRRHARTDVLKGARVSWQWGGERLTSRISDLGLGGLFIETAEPLAVGTIIDVVFEGPGKEVRARVVVRRAVAGKGMGVEFVAIGSDDQARLRGLLQSSQAPASAARAHSAPAARGKDEAKTDAEDDLPDKRRERRAHFRHKIAALVECVDETGKKVKGHLSNLGQEGCYVKTEATLAIGTPLSLTITKDGDSFRTKARVVYCLAGKGMGVLFTSVAPDSREVLETWLGASLEITWLADSRRRSQRIALTVPVQVAGRNNLGTEFSEDTCTLTISPHGALVLLSTTLSKGQRIQLTNVRTKATVECAVVYIAQGKGKQREVGLSFALPNRAFWKVAFPPADWSPHHSDAKRSDPSTKRPAGN